MRVLVTGGAGFIGRYVNEALVEAGHEVYALDQRWPWPGGRPIKLGIREIAGDITLRPPWPGIPEPLDCIIHLAAIASPGICDRDPALAFNVNVNGTHNVLKLALWAGVKRVVFASSAHVYGISPKYMPTDERHPLWLQDVYTTTKLLGEELCRLYYDNHGLNYGVLRLFNGYGPGQPEGYFIPDMIAKARAGKIDLKGGNVTKDFVYVADVARAFVLMVESTYVGPINVGWGDEVRLSAVASYISQNTGAPLVLADGGPEPTRMWCDRRRARAVLGWEPTVSLGQGLQRTMEAGKNNDTGEERPVAP
ncbi:MAG: NAD-dependent epimerase/dehydratase family protein [Dehalococcoidia bacterium]|nr:NAD-dependent epimerase/dehydratase family protein [Dehalococcoidia bacterium]